MYATIHNLCSYNFRLLTAVSFFLFFFLLYYMNHNLEFIYLNRYKGIKVNQNDIKLKYRQTQASIWEFR